ncbi:hypothetical protein [Orientia tsutsugamushi]
MISAFIILNYLNQFRKMSIIKTINGKLKHLFHIDQSSRRRICYVFSN